MAGNIFQTLLQMVVDKDSFNAVDSVLGKMDEGISAVNDRFVSIGKFAQGAASNIVDSLQQAVGAVDPLQERLDELDKTVFAPKVVVDTTEAQKQIDDFFASLGQAEGGLDGGAGRIGGTALTRVGSGFKQLGLDDLGNAIQKLGAAQRVSGFVSKLGDTLLDAANSIPGVTSAIAALAPKIGVASAQFVVMGGIIGAVGIALVAVTSILGALQKQAEDAHKTLEAGLDAQHEYYELIKKGSADAVEAKAKELRAQQAADEAQKQTVQALYDEAKQRLDESQKLFGGEGAGEGDPLADPRVVAYLETTRKKLEADGLLAEGQKVTYQTTDDLKKRLDDLTLSEQSAGNWAGQYEKALASGTLTSKDATKGEEELLKKRADALGKLQDLQDKWDETAAAAVQETNKINEDRLTQSTREQEDHDLTVEREQAAHDAKMLEMQVKGDAEIEAKKQENIDRLGKADEAIQKLYDSLGDITEKAHRQEVKVDRDYYQNQVEQKNKHNDNLSKIDEESNKARIKILNQLALDLRDAEVANDVIAFVAAKKRAAQQLSELDQNKVDAKQSEQERFDDEQKKAQEAHDQRIADIEEQAALQRAQVEENIAAKQDERDKLKIQLDQELKDKQDAVAAQAKAEQDAYDLRVKQDNEDRDTKLKRQKEDEDTADRRRQDAADKELASINKEIAAQQTAFDLINAAWKGGALGVASYITTTLGNAIQGLIGQAHQLSQVNIGGNGSNPYGPPASANQSNQNPFSWFGTNYPPSSTGSGGGPNHYTPTSFAGGGIRDKAMWARFGDVPSGYAEAAIPFKKSEGIEAALAQYGLKGSGGGGDTYVVNLNGDIHQSVDREYLKTELTNLMKGAANGISKARKP